MTFTSKAILEDLLGVYQLIEKLDRHLLWSCFIPPAVVGAVARASRRDSDPLKLFDQ